MNNISEALASALKVLIHEMTHATSSTDRIAAAAAILELAKHQNLYGPTWLGSHIRTELEN